MQRFLERPKSLTDLAHDSIRQLIVSGQIGLGEQLSEASLAAQLGISKTPVREALLRLRVDGLVDIQPQRGTFVFSLSTREVEEICRFREFVEVAALGGAMRERRAELVAALQANVAQMARAHDAGDWRAIPSLDQSFHQVIVDHCGNSYIKQSYQLIASKIAAMRARLPEENERVGHCQENHAAIVRLIANAAPAEAQQALALHIQDTLQSYMAAISPEIAASSPPWPRVAATGRAPVSRPPDRDPLTSAQ
jgi:DNA-binding GntR family transcriptional regulator